MPIDRHVGVFPSVVINVLNIIFLFNERLSCLILEDNCWCRDK